MKFARLYTLGWIYVPKRAFNALFSLSLYRSEQEINVDPNIRTRRSQIPAEAFGASRIGKDRGEQTGDS